MFSKVLTEPSNDPRFTDMKTQQTVAYSSNQMDFIHCELKKRIYNKGEKNHRKTHIIVKHDVIMNKMGYKCEYTMVKTIN
jgi:hypothetical protein